MIEIKDCKEIIILRSGLTRSATSLPLLDLVFAMLLSWPWRRRTQQSSLLWLASRTRANLILWLKFAWPLPTSYSAWTWSQHDEYHAIALTVIWPWCRRTQRRSWSRGPRRWMTTTSRGSTWRSSPHAFRKASLNYKSLLSIHTVTNFFT